MTEEDAKLGIGALSKATGIPVETLRTWERRYGFPAPERNEAGHRVYRLSTARHLQYVDRALKEGHRASMVLSLSLDELQSLVDSTEGGSFLAESPAHERTRESVAYAEGVPSVEAWLDATIRFDGEALERHLRRSWHELGALRFFNERVSPFLREVGDRWAEAKLDIAHEHFASERLRDFLTSQWRPLSDRSRGPRVLLSTLPSETHCLGLQMAATILAIAGARVIYLGTDTPIDDIVQAARNVDAVILSISVASNRFMTRREITRLREKLPDHIDIILGGEGASFELQGVHVLRDLSELTRWVQNLSHH